MKRRTLPTLLLLAALILPATSNGAPRQAEEQPATGPSTHPTFPRPHTLDREFTVSPARADAPDAFARSALWPDPLTYTRDNAATLYLAAMVQLPPYPTEEEQVELMVRLMDATPETLDGAEAEKYLAPFASALRTIEPATSRPRAVWDRPWPEQGYHTSLDLAPMREIAKALRLRGNLHLSRGDTDRAVDGIRQVFVMAAHVGDHDEAVLIEGLVGIGIASMGAYHVKVVIEQPETPSLYHALMALPDPLFQLRTWVEMEHRVFYRSVPQLYRPAEMDEAAWLEVWRQFVGIGLSESGWGFHDLAAEEQRRVVAELAASRREQMIPAAIAYFAERDGGEAALREEAERNPYPLLARYMTATMDEFMRRSAAAAQLPFEDAYPRLRELSDQAEQVAWWHGPEGEGLAMPVDRALIAIARYRQSVAMTIVLEALRDHAAEHGRWPDALDELRLYAPDDPISGEPFDYRRDGDTAILRAAADQRPPSGYEWRVTLRQH
jgi:hypothetical protein